MDVSWDISWFTLHLYAGPFFVARMDASVVKEPPKAVEGEGQATP